MPERSTSRSPKGWALLFAAWAVAAAGWVVGCSGGTKAPPVDDTPAGPGGAGGVGKQGCAGHEEGCACATEGRQVDCGFTSSPPGTPIECTVGKQTCTSGKWGVCVPNAGASRAASLRIRSLAGNSVDCNDPCSPDCKQWVETPDSLADPDAGIFVSDGGITIGTTLGSTTPTPADLAALADAGALPAGSFIFHELLPGQVAANPDPIDNLNPQPSGGDVYFTLDDTSSMGDEAQALRNALAGTGMPVTCSGLSAPGQGVIANLKCRFGQDVFIGLGRYEDYGISPYVTYLPNNNLPYQHLLSQQISGDVATSAAQWLRDDAYDAALVSFRNGGDVPESASSALWAAATGLALNRSSTGTPPPWYGPRSLWTSPMTGTWIPALDAQNPSPCGPFSSSAPGYPCWRALTNPIFIVITDAPSHNGPGGQYAYPQYAWTSIQGATLSPQAFTGGAPTWSNPSATSATPFDWANTPEIELQNDSGGDLVATPRLYWGNVPSGTSASHVSGGVVNFTVDALGQNGRRSLRDCNPNQFSTTTCDIADTPADGQQDIVLPEPPWAQLATVQNCGGVTYTHDWGVSGSYLSGSDCVSGYASPAFGTALSHASGAFQIVTGGGGANGPGGGGTWGVYAPGVVAGSSVTVSVRMVDNRQIPGAAARVYARLCSSATTGGTCSGWSPNNTWRDCTVSTQGATTTCPTFYTVAANQVIQYQVIYRNASGTNLSAGLPNGPLVEVTAQVGPANLGACAAPRFASLSFDNGARCCPCNSGATPPYAFQSASHPLPDRCERYTTSCPSDKSFTAICPSPVSPPLGAPAGNCGNCAGLTAPNLYGTRLANNRCEARRCDLPFSYNGGINNVGGAGWQMNGGACMPPATVSNICGGPASGRWCNDGSTTPAAYRFCNARYGNSDRYTSGQCRCDNAAGGAGGAGSPRTDDPTPPGPAPANGLTAYYYNTSPNQAATSGWAGLALARYDANVNFNWGSASPSPGVVNDDNFTTRWEGRVLAPCTGRYTFSANVDDAGFLWVDNKQLYVRYTVGSQDAYPIDLVAGQYYDIRFEQAENGGNAVAQLSWRANCSASASGVTLVNNTNRIVPTQVLFPTGYVGQGTVGAYGQCARAGTARLVTNCTTTFLGAGAGNREAIYKFSVPAGRRIYYHFALLRSDASLTRDTGAGATPAGDRKVSPTDSEAFLYIKRRADAESAARSNVMDCNANASQWTLEGTDRGIRSQLSGYLEAGDYYLVVDRNGNAASYNYVLMAGQWDDTRFAAPSHEQTVAALKSIGAKIIGIDTSGTRCGQAHLANPAQYETRDYLDKLAADTDTIDGTLPTTLPKTARTFNISLKNDASACAAGTTDPTASLTASINEAVRKLAETLRQDFTVRAQPSGASPTPLPAPPEAFIHSVAAVPNGPAPFNLIDAKCGPPPSAAIGPDLPDRTKYIQCLPGTPIGFRVKFQVPSSVMLLDTPQYFRFDALVLGNGSTVFLRQPVVIKVPARIATVDTIIRDYDATTQCQFGARVRWQKLKWDVSAPLPAANENSSVEFWVSTGNDRSELGVTEKLAATATSLPPPGNEVSSTSLESALAAIGTSNNQNWLRVRAFLKASPNGANAPILRGWNVVIECMPSE